MPTPSPIVAFTLQVDAIKYLPEAEFGPDLSAALAVMGQSRVPFGELVISAAGQPGLGLYDDLLPLAGALRFVLRRLRAGEGGQIGSRSQPDRLRFERDGEDLLVIDEAGQQQRHHAVPLVDALGACLDRLLALLRRAAPDDAQWQAQVDRLAIA